MKNIFFRLSLCLVLSISIVIISISCQVNEGNDIETTQIFEIQNTAKDFSGKDSKIITIRKHYMIINPSKDLHELKVIAENYLDHNSINVEKNNSKNKVTVFEVYFYRKSKKLPIDWQPNEEYLDTDRIEHHRDDIIVAVYWSESDKVKEYYCMQKSTNKDNYGKVLKEVKYIGDKIVK